MKLINNIIKWIKNLKEHYTVTVLCGKCHNTFSLTIKTGERVLDQETTCPKCKLKDTLRNGIHHYHIN